MNHLTPLTRIDQPATLRNVALTAALTLAMSAAAGAMFVTTTWIAASGDWATGGNWNTGNVPTAADEVRILNGGTARITAAGAVADSVAIGGDSRLTVSGAGELTSGDIDVTGADLSVTDGGEITQTGGATLRTGGAGQAFLTVEGAGSRVNWVGGTVILGSDGTSFLTLSDGGELAAGSITTAADTSAAIRVGSGGIAGVLSADVEPTTGSTSLYFNHTNDISFGRDISGPTAVGKFAAGTLTLTNANTYTGGTLVIGGTLRAGAANAVGLGPMTVDSPATLDLNGFDQSVTTLEGSGAIATGSATLRVTFDSESRTFSGAISGNSLRKAGDGTLTLTGTNTHTFTFVEDGAVFINGTQPGSNVVVEGGWLGGSGQLAELTSTSGVVSPGDDFGSTGILTSATASFNASTALDIRVSGVTPGSDHDQLAVAGSVSLGGADLSVDSTTVASGTILTILNNTGGGAISGTFAGLPEGAIVDGGDQAFAISYVGGDGNDITLLAVEGVPSMPLLALLLLGGLVGWVAYARLRL